ncbi:MAG: hypothetical protein HKN16_09300 [Saprospiraceae bacterium]|nr:hypothetical protein [Saprospiraceae bacterium]
MYKLLTKNGQLYAFGLGAVLTVLSLIMILGGLEDFNMLAVEDKPTTGIFNLALYAGIGLVILCAIAMVAFGIFQVAMHPKESLKGLIGFGALVVLFFIARAMAGGDSPEMTALLERFNIDEGTNGLISGGLMTTLIIGGLAIAALVFSEIRNFFK